MGGFETVIPEVLKQVASDMDSSVPPYLDAAKADFTDGDVEGESFSNVGLDCAIAFPSAREFMLSECERTTDEVKKLVEKLEATALIWSLADSQSTIDLPSC